MFEIGFSLVGDFAKAPISNLVRKGARDMVGTWANVQWYKELLQDKRTDKMDLNYWIDYVKQFGVDHKIPAYDNMSFIKWYNLDLISAAVLVIYSLFSVVWWSLTCWCSRAEKEKVK